METTDEWLDGFALGGGSAALEAVEARQVAAQRALAAVKAAVEIQSSGKSWGKSEVLLSACRVFMRDRRGIDCLLTEEALDLFLQAASTGSWPAREEALKCAINAIYDRPDFISGLVDSTSRFSFTERLLAHARQRGRASWLTLVWKTLLVACDSSVMTQALAHTPEIWSLLTSTTGYIAFSKREDTPESLELLLVEMLKLVAVLMNVIKWADGDAAASSVVLENIHRLGEILLLVFDSDFSINAKNRAAEVFMFLPPALAAAFVDNQRKISTGGGCDDPREGILAHLQAVLIATRVEKSRPISDMLPVLILCHNLTLAGSPSTFASFFQAAILPQEQTTTSRHARRAAFLFGHLKFFLTCLDTDVKRFAGEWLYLLCNQNAEEYTRRTGVGNAIGMLRVKGLA